MKELFRGEKGVEMGGAGKGRAVETRVKRPYSVLELIPVLGSQPAGDVNHINPTVGCHYFPPGQQLPPQPFKGLLPILLLGELNRVTMGVNSLPKTVSRQRRDCDLNPGPSAPESSTLTTRLRRGGSKEIYA